MTLRCTVCKGTNVEMAMWVNPNTNEVGGDFGTFNYGDNTFCNDCGENHDLEDVPAKKTRRKTTKKGAKQ
jgi:hypothetical protein